MNEPMKNTPKDYEVTVRMLRRMYKNQSHMLFSRLWEIQRKDFVENDIYRGLDLDFNTLMLMRGLTQHEFDTFNKYSIDYRNL